MVSKLLQMEYTVHGSAVEQYAKVGDRGRSTVLQLRIVERRCKQRSKMRV